MPSNLIGILGIIVILAIAVAFSSNRKAIHLRVVAAAFVLQAVIAAFVLYFDWGRRAINWLSFGVLAVIRYSKAGIDMVFGPLADTDVVGFSFAINVLPIIIFFAALMSVLYHLRIMEWLVRIVGGALHKIIGTGAIESMNAAANQGTHRCAVLHRHGLGTRIHRRYGARGLRAHGRRTEIPACGGIHGGTGRAPDGQDHHAR
jgi:CNT family concentrative nucleoside transporter